MSEAEVRKRSFAAGYLAGLSGMPLAIVPTQEFDGAVAYLYNDSPLPQLRWDKKTYPYALIQYYQKTGLFRFCVYKSINYYQGTPMFGSAPNYFGQQESGASLMFDYKPGESGWVQNSSEPGGIRVDRGINYGYVVVWTNFDLMYSDNTLYVGASDPIPLTDVDTTQRNSYNGVVLPKYSNYDYAWRHVIFWDISKKVYVKVEYFYTLAWVFGSPYKVGVPSPLHDDISIETCPPGGNEWTEVDSADYIVTEQYNSKDYYCFCQLSDVIWSEEGLYYASNANTAFEGSEPVSVDIPEPEPPSVYATDNKAVMLGCRLGYIIRSQMGEGRIEIPAGVLISADGYILTDCNGLYLIAKEDA